MKKTTLYLLTAVIFVMLANVSCSPKYFKPRHFEKMKWIEGHWSSTEQGITITEIWKTNSNTGFDGTGFIVAGRDTLFKEQMQIRKGPKSSIVLESKAGQVHFESSDPMKLTSLKNKRFVFKTETNTKTVKYTNRKKDVLLIDILELTDNEITRTKYTLQLLQ
jgi:hypothetical protein